MQCCLLMSRQVANLNSSRKQRKRPENRSGLVDAERSILNLIRSKKDLGIWIKDIKQDAKLNDPTVNKSLKSLLAKKLIKEVVNFQSKAKKHYMAIEFEPSKEITGGDWYVNGELDIELIDVLKRLCHRYIRLHKVATTEGVHNDLKKNRAVLFDITNKQVGEILNLMVLDNDIIEVKSTGLGEYHSIPIGTVCYRVATVAGGAKRPRLGAFASIPCGVCPRISLCTPDGVISPATCVYYTKWLNIDF